MFFQNINTHILDDIEYICGLMFKILHIPVFFLDNNGDIFYAYTSNHPDNPVYNNKKELFEQLFKNEDFCEFPIIKSSKYMENYFSITLIIEDVFIGTFIIGPSTYSYIEARTIDSFIKDYKISLSYKRQLINYFNALTIMDHNQLVSSSILFYSLVNNKQLHSEVVLKNSLTSLDVKSDFENNLSKNRQNTFFHHSQTHTKIMLQCIREGNKESLARQLDQPLDGKYGILSKNNPLRSEKNLIICNVTLVTQAAIDGGLTSEFAYTLSDSYIQAVEDITDIKDLSYLNIKMLNDFVERVNFAKKSKYSKAIISSENYILKYLYKDISLKELAKVADLNPNYLSELFKKEVGITISEYIQKEKIEEAKRLLITSNYSIMDIATWLNFNDQSHFTRLFKKITALTPKKYRDRNILD